MRRAESGESLTIGFIGGSITQGSLASEQDRTYARLVLSWWQKSFPKARFHYVNGGIGGTTSHYGVARVVSDVLMDQPDFVIADFSVNDEANSFFQETYEGLIRKILSWDSKPAVVLLNNVYYDTGASAQDWHHAIGQWYQVPSVSIRDTVYSRILSGELAKEELTPDGLHPNDRGHALVAAEIIAFLEKVRADTSGNEEDISLPVPMTENAYENARRLTNREVSPELNGFQADTREKTDYLDHFKNGWIGRKPGDSILFEVEASCIAVQYRKTVDRPAAIAKLILDGDSCHARLLDGNFDEDWGDCLYLEPVLHHGELTRHTIKIEIVGTEQTSAAPFYLMSLIIA